MFVCLYCILWLYTPQPVAQIMVNDKHEATGVVLDDESEIRAKVVLSNATPKVTYLDLLAEVSWRVKLVIISTHAVWVFPGCPVNRFQDTSGINRLYKSCNQNKWYVLFLDARLVLMLQSFPTTVTVALSGLPSFSCLPNSRDGLPSPHHQCTIHLNTETTDKIHSAYLDAQQGRWSTRY